MWNSLPNDMVKADIINTIKRVVWINIGLILIFNQHVCNWKSTNLCVKVMLRWGQRGLPAPIRTHWIG